MGDTQVQSELPIISGMDSDRTDQSVNSHTYQIDSHHYKLTGVIHSFEDL